MPGNFTAAASIQRLPTNLIGFWHCATRIALCTMVSEQLKHHSANSEQMISFIAAHQYIKGILCH